MNKQMKPSPFVFTTKYSVKMVVITILAIWITTGLAAGGPIGWLCLIPFWAIFVLIAGLITWCEVLDQCKADRLREQESRQSAEHQEELSS